MTQQAGRHLVRAKSPRVLSGAGAVWLLGPAPGDTSLLEGESGDLVLAVLDHARSPAQAEAIVASVAAQAEVDLSQRRAIDDAIALLVRVGALVDADAPQGAKLAARTGNVVLAITGAIGAVHAHELVQHLLYAGHDVRVAMTRAARRFVTVRAFEALTHRNVATSLWKGQVATPAPHVELAQWADIVVVCPCTATTLSRIAAGDCSNVVSAVATTTLAPVLLVPSMNTHMFHAPLVQRNLQQLREAGFFVAHPGHGHEVADAPAARVARMGVAAPAASVHRYVELLLDRAASNGPRVLSRAQWNAQHQSDAVASTAPDVDADIASAVEAYAPRPSRLIDVGTGLGNIARAFARLGHTVVATDFSPLAIERAHAATAELPVTWLCDDATASRLRASFDVCIDRACFGCVAAERRARYIAQIAAWVRPDGLWLLKVHREPLGTLHAYAFTIDEIRELASSAFDLVAARESTLAFGAWSHRPAWTVELRRRRLP